MTGGTVTVTFAAKGRAVSVPAGTTVLQAAQQAGCSITATCGARGRCRSCRVQIVGGSVPPAGLADRIQLGDDEVGERYRLACQAEVWDDLTVLVAPVFEEAAFQILAETRALRSAAGFILDSGVVKTHLVPSPPASEEHPASDLEALLRHLDREVGDVPLDVLRRIPGTLRTGSSGLTAVLFDRTLLAVEPGDTRTEAYGMAFDIGTTTVVGYLVDLWSGTVAATAAGLNPQSAFGGDLMSRIAFAQEDPANVRRLHTRILQLLNGQIEEVCNRAGVDRERIYKVVVVGNTAMHHLFLGIDPTYVGQAPYAPGVRRGLRVAASDVGLRLRPPTPVCLLPIVAGFVGADAVGMVLSTRLDESRAPRIAADIGTNGEMVMASPDGLLACSAPAGPALEGAQLRCGMRAARGAIDQVRIDGDVCYHVIGSGAPLGVCGSGILDAIAGLLDAGLLDAGGRLHPEPPASAPDALRRRVVTLADGRPAFVLADASESATGQAIVLTQADIRQVQLAKGAIRSGIAMLLHLTQTPADRLAEVMLAGGFGNYLNIRSAVRVGLIPPLPVDRVTYVGNAAGLGAQMALVSETERGRAEALARRIRHVSLATHPAFQEVFLDALRFG
ncbi:MAG: ASKHA domain-containing protein [Armatimonadota bacterium]|nr:ASKHA domain-containing protein [Armatimonadota bacterium]